VYEMSGNYLVGSCEQTKVLTKTESDVRTPRKFKVVLHNDDYTPMDFVVAVLKRFFNMSSERATQTMLEIHFKGKGICGVFTRDIAKTKVAFVNDFSQSNEYPLLCRMEPD